MAISRPALAELWNYKRAAVEAAARYLAAVTAPPVLSWGTRPESITVSTEGAPFRFAREEHPGWAVWGNEVVGVREP